MTSEQLRLVSSVSQPTTEQACTGERLPEFRVKLSEFFGKHSFAFVFESVCISAQPLHYKGILRCYYLVDVSKDWLMSTVINKRGTDCR